MIARYTATMKYFYTALLISALTLPAAAVITGPPPGGVNTSLALSGGATGGQPGGPAKKKPETKAPPRDTVAILIGTATASDGDSLIMNNQRLRIEGIDAPELKQRCGAPDKTWPCGQVAADRLAALVKGKKLLCRYNKTDTYGRPLVTCAAGKSPTLGATMVKEGHAIAYLYYTDIYMTEHDEAKAANRGIWAGPFTEPYLWRRQNPRN